MKRNEKKEKASNWYNCQWPDVTVFPDSDNMKKIKEIAAEARNRGMTYGQYIASVRWGTWKGGQNENR